MIKKPAKPSSGYNIFYQAESRRARNRERSRKRFVSRFPQNNTKYDQAANTTRLIGGKWKGLSPNSQSLFFLRGKNELELYNTRKVLWAANEHMSPEIKISKEDAMVSGMFPSIMKTPSETYRQLAFFLF